MANKLLLIGVDYFRSFTRKTDFVRDVIDFGLVLVEKYGFEEADITELYNQDATKKNLIDALNMLSSNVDKNDNLIIYYLGLSIYNKSDGKGYWIPYDGDKDFSTWIPNEFVISSVGKLKAGNILLIANGYFSPQLMIKTIMGGSSQHSNITSRWCLISNETQVVENINSPVIQATENIVSDYFSKTILLFLNEKNKDFYLNELASFLKSNSQRLELAELLCSSLRLPDHRGGEYKFVIKQPTATGKFKGYRDFLKLLQLYKRNTDFKEISIVEDRINKVGFKLYQENDSVQKKTNFYLYLFEGIVQTKTFNYLSKYHRNILNNRSTILFLSKEKSVLNLEARMKNVVKKFTPLSSFYLDDFIRDRLTPKMIKEEESDFLSISNFILPSYQSDINITNLDSYVYEWFSKDDEPILVVKGAGGIGKTTFAQYIADKIVLVNKKTSVLFIDSLQIKDSLLTRRKTNKAISIYNFYEALHEISDNLLEKLNEELFQVNFDAGNLLLIIDGLDEVISKLPDFDVDFFLDSINEITQIGGGKVIITCRTYFWDTATQLRSKFNSIELLPFSLSQTKSFFEKSFDNDNSKVKRALKIADDFKYPENDGENIFHPYVLDIIRSIIITDGETIIDDLTIFNSRILKNSVKNDYIVYRICYRERLRIGQIDVDDQLRFFIFMAAEAKGSIRVEMLKQEIERALGRHIDKTNIEAFKAHPFLQHFERTTRFRYDFLTDYFRGMYIADFFDYESTSNEPTDLFVNVVIDNCWFGSPMISDVAARVTHWTDNDLYLVSHIIELISDSQTIEATNKKKAIANIFNICLAINKKFKQNNIDDNTTLLVSIFQSSKGVIENLSIININNADQRIRFDFSDKIINQAYIHSYNSFWSCKFNDKTLFTDCHLLNLQGLKERNIAVSKNNFKDCTYDETVTNAFYVSDNNETDKKGKARLFLQDFFHLFISNGKLGRQWEDEVIKPRFSGINKYSYNYKHVIRIMKSQKVIKIYENLGTQKKLEIEQSYREDITKFVKDGTSSNIISILSDELSKL